MASKTVKSLIDTITGLLQDLGNNQWTVTDLLGFYNLALTEVVSLNDSANATIIKVKLAPGSKHSTPANAMKLLDIISNMGTDGNTDGEAITRADLMAVEAFDRSWRTATAEDEIVNWIPDPDDKHTFYTYPPSTGDSFILMKIAKKPDEVVYDDDGDWENILIEVIDDFVDAIIDKVMEYAYKTDSDIQGNKAREDDSGNEFMTEMAARAQ